MSWLLGCWYLVAMMFQVVVKFEVRHCYDILDSWYDIPGGCHVVAMISQVVARMVLHGCYGTPGGC